MDNIINQINHPFITLIIAMIFHGILSSISIVFSRVWTKKNTGSSSEFQKTIVNKILLMEENSARVSITLALSRILAAIIIFLSISAILVIIQKDILLAIAITPLLTISLSYALPRAFTRVFANSLTIVFYIFYTFFDKLLFPISFIINLMKLTVYKIFNFDSKFYFLSNEERTTFSEDTSKDVLQEKDRDMIHSIFEFVDTDVKEIMVPRIDINAIEDTMTILEILDEINKYGHSRIPVFNESIDSIFGILYVKDLLKAVSDKNGLNTDAKFDIKKLVRKPYFIPGSKKIDDLLSEFRKNKVHIAVIVDEYGGTLGIVTMEDIIEEIVGEIQDEYDNETPLIEKVNNNTYMIDPKIGISDLNDELETNFTEEDISYDTLSGLIQEKLGSIPKEGDTLETDGVSISVNKMDGQRIDKVCLKKSKKVENSNNKNA